MNTDLTLLQKWLRGDQALQGIDSVGLQERDTMLANSFPLPLLMDAVDTVDGRPDRMDDLLCAISICHEDDTLEEEGVSRIVYDRFISQHRERFRGADHRISLAADFCKLYLATSQSTDTGQGGAAKRG